MANPVSPLQLGDTALDADHEKLHDLITVLMAVPPQQALGVLETLRSHAASHFLAEDADLRGMLGDGNAQCHLDEHANVLKSLDEVRAVLAGDEVGAGAKERLVQSLGEHLLAWLPEHVQEMDQGVATHRTKQRFGGAPVTLTRKPPPG